MTTFSNKLIALARAAGALSIPFVATRTPEQLTALDKLTAACLAAKPPVLPGDVYAAASTADAVKRAPAKPKPTETDAADAMRASAAASGQQAKADKPQAEKPSKPSDADAKRASEYDARVALVGELRSTCAALYNGPSLAVRSNPKRFTDAIYADLFAAPKHRTTLAKLTPRDESLLFTVLKRGERNGSFDPVHLNLDCGIFSRLASVGFIARDGQIYTLTADALTHARKAAKRAA